MWSPRRAATSSAAERATTGSGTLSPTTTFWPTPIPGDVCDTESPTCTGYFRDEYREFNARIGGPIVKDRIWFYASGQYFRSNTFDPGTIVSSEGDTPNRTRPVRFQGHRQDWRTARALRPRPRGRWGGGVSPSPFYTQSANVEETGSNPAWGATWTSILSDQSLLELKYAGWWSDDIYQSATQSFDEPFIDYTPEQGGPTRYSGGLWFPWDYTTWRQQFNAKVTTYADDFLNAQHDLRFGVQFSQGPPSPTAASGPTAPTRTTITATPIGSYQDPVPVRRESRDLGSSSTTR